MAPVLPWDDALPNLVVVGTEDNTDKVIPHTIVRFHNSIGIGNKGIASRPLHVWLNENLPAIDGRKRYTVCHNHLEVYDPADVSLILLRWS